jgi:hypothetical protein
LVLRKISSTKSRKSFKQHAAAYTDVFLEALANAALVGLLPVDGRLELVNEVKLELKQRFGVAKDDGNLLLVEHVGAATNLVQVALR